MNYNDFDAILFDMDGTIFDSETVHREAWKITAAGFGQLFTDEMYLQFIGKTTPDCMKLALQGFDREIALEGFSKSYYENLAALVEKEVPLKEGFSAYFEFVKSLDKPMAIVTSSAKQGVTANFAHYDFYSEFQLVLTRDDVKHFKPDPEPYLLACQKLSVKPERVLVFEDSNTGALAAIEAGCFTVGIPDLVPFNLEVAQRLSMELKSFNDLL